MQSSQKSSNKQNITLQLQMTPKVSIMFSHAYIKLILMQHCPVVRIHKYILLLDDSKVRANANRNTT